MDAGPPQPASEGILQVVEGGLLDRQGVPARETQGRRGGGRGVEVAQLGGAGEEQLDRAERPVRVAEAGERPVGEGPGAVDRGGESGNPGIVVPPHPGDQDVGAGLPGIRRLL